MSDHTELLAMVPILRHGIDLPDEYTFSCDARLTRQSTPEFLLQSRNNALFGLNHGEDASWAVATAWLIMANGAAIGSEDCVHQLIARQAIRVQQLLWWIDMAGVGKNYYWYTAGLHLNCVYVVDMRTQVLLAHRYPFIHSTVYDEQTPRWTKANFQLADRLDRVSHQLSNPAFTYIRRAVEYRLAITRLNWECWRQRAQLALTAIELLCAHWNSGRKLYLWHSAEKIRSISGSPLDWSANGEVNVFRNELIHRGGVNLATELNKRTVSELIMGIEDALRRMIVWEIQNISGN